jgi:hypothetical protein
MTDEELRQRLVNTEDHLTERKEAPKYPDTVEALVMLANSALPDRPGILYVGVADDGTIVGGDNVASWQTKITRYSNNCFPPITTIPTVLRQGDLEFLAIVIPYSGQRPHFPGPALVRDGAGRRQISKEEVDEWITYRASKVRFILDWKGKIVTVQILKESHAGQIADFTGGEYELVDCNSFYITIKSIASGAIRTYPLTRLDLKLDDKNRRLMLLLTPYY